jgi:hypothetical protein
MEEKNEREREKRKNKGKERGRRVGEDWGMRKRVLGRGGWKEGDD